MKQRNIYFIFLLGISLLITSCSFLKSEHYPGEPINFETKDIGKETVWKLNSDKVFHAVILDNQQVRVGNIEWNKDSEDFFAVNQNVIVTKLGENNFLNIEDDHGMYNILKFTASSENNVIAYTVNKDKMQEFIEDGKLNASIDDESIILHLSKPELDEFIENHINDIFNYNNPFVFQKIFEKSTREEQ